MLAGGLDRSHPAEHSYLLHPIGDVILLVSELPSGSPPVRPQNRLMAGVPGATVVSESGERSGTMSNALTARELGRGVGAVPCPMTSAANIGPNELIKQNFISLINQPSEAITLLDAEAISKRRTARPELGRQSCHCRSGTIDPAATQPTL